MERYGITKRGEQYTGWKQLGSGFEMPEAQMSFTDAAHFVADAAGDPNWYIDIASDPEFATALYRDAAKHLHPDTGGTTEDFQRLQAAMDVIKAAS